jgi:hypothetical protein
MIHGITACGAQKHRQTRGIDNLRRRLFFRVRHPYRMRFRRACLLYLVCHILCGIQQVREEGEHDKRAHQTAPGLTA